MFNYSKLTPKAREFVVGLGSMGRSRTVATSIALARALVWNRALPSSPVESPVLFYRTQISPQVTDMICMINEMAMVDVTAVQDFAESFWMTRYNTAHPKPNVLALDKERAVEDFFGLSRTVSPETITLIKQYNTELTILINGFVELIGCLSAEGTVDEVVPDTRSQAVAA